LRSSVFGLDFFVWNIVKLTLQFLLLKQKDQIVLTRFSISSSRDFKSTSTSTCSSRNGHENRKVADEDGKIKTAQAHTFWVTETPESRHSAFHCSIARDTLSKDIKKVLTGAGMDGFLAKYLGGVTSSKAVNLGYDIDKILSRAR
jgi:hypothetical protein